MTENFEDGNRFPEATLPDEEPVGIVKPNESMLQQTPPKGTSYNKKTALTVFALLAVAFIVVILIGVASANKKAVTPQEIGSTETRSGSEKNLTPTELLNIPDTYHGNLANGNEAGLPVRPDGSVAPSEVRVYPSSPAGPKDDYIPPAPPALHPIQTEPVQIKQAGLNPEQQEREAARKSPIRFSATPVSANTGKPSIADNPLAILDSLSKAANQYTAALSNTQQPATKSDQDEKLDFRNMDRSTKFYASSRETKALSPYEIKAGSIIPAVMITGINSDLPGAITAQVRENVYDTVTGRYLLIPQGSRVIGIYDSKIAFGQERVLVVWSRLIFPNGNSLDLQGLAGTDPSGYSGLKDRVNNHYGKIIGGVLVASVISWGAKKATEGSAADDPFATSVAQNAVDVGTRLTDKNINIQPTIEIKPGYSFNLFVDKDFILPPY